MKIIHLVFMLSVLIFVIPASADTVTLRYASPYPPGHPFSLADIAWMNWVEKESGGELRISPIWSGALLSSDQSLIEVRHGVTDIGLISPIYSNGGAHFIKLQTGFYGGARTPEQQVAMYRCLANVSAAYDSELTGLKILAVQGGALPGVLLRSKPLKTLDDFKGLRIRAPAELLDVLKDLGADPVNMPMNQVYSALAKGIIDGVIAPADTLKTMHLGDVAHFYTALAVARGAYPARAIGTRRWLSLSRRNQEVLESSISIWEYALAQQTRAAPVAGTVQEGVRFFSISESDQRRFDEVYEGEVERNAQRMEDEGTDALEVFKTARAIARDIPRDGVHCQELAKRPH